MTFTWFAHFVLCPAVFGAIVGILAAKVFAR